eukprot:8185574-Lingulodinium_polyedra.AAC.1
MRVSALAWKLMRSLSTGSLTSPSCGRAVSPRSALAATLTGRCTGWFPASGGSTVRAPASRGTKKVP